MSLYSPFFVLFLPIAALIYYIIPQKHRYIWLFAASWFFYLSNDIRFLPALAFCTVTTYLAGIFLEKESGIKRKAILTLCVSANILLLLLFRYFNSMPLGMLFYSLQAIGYTADVYLDKVTAERNPVKYAAFVAFFPAVISGPIQRSHILLPQISAGRNFDYKKAHTGLYLLLWGYFLKAVLANPLGIMVDYAFENDTQMPGATLLWAVGLYAIQLYCDFAGYSALAIGTAKIFGFDICENFSQPYFAASIKDFWNRWHISLSSWLRDYIYIPLGGNRKGKLRKCGNLMVTFLISGLWHGYGMNFLVWGALHGLYQIMASLRKQKQKAGFPRRILQGILTFILVDFAWLFFRANSMEQALFILRQIVFHFQFRQMTYYGSYLLGGTKAHLLCMLIAIGIVFLVDCLHEKNISIESIMMRHVNVVLRWCVYIALTVMLLLIIVRNYGLSASTFIYARF